MKYSRLDVLIYPTEKYDCLPLDYFSVMVNKRSKPSLPLVPKVV